MRFQTQQVVMLLYSALPARGVESTRAALKAVAASAPLLSGAARVHYWSQLKLLVMQRYVRSGNNPLKFDDFWKEWLNRSVAESSREIQKNYVEFVNTRARYKFLKHWECSRDIPSAQRALHHDASVAKVGGESRDSRKPASERIPKEGCLQVTDVASA